MLTSAGTSMLMIRASSNATDGPPSVTFDKTWSYTFISCIIECILFGVSMTKVLNFFTLRARAGFRSPDYFISGHIWIIIITIFTCVQFFSMVVYDYNTFVVNFNNETSDWKITSAACSEQMGLYLTIFSGQMFYVSKLWKSTHNLSYIFPTAFLSFTALASGIVEVIRATRQPEFYQLHSTESTFALQNAATVACDILISILICYDLREQRSGFRDIDELLTQMSYYAINCGIATSISALAMMILVLFQATHRKNFGTDCAEPLQIVNSSQILIGSWSSQIAQQISAQLYIISVVAMVSSDGDLKKALKMEKKSIVLHRFGVMDVSPSLNVDAHVETTKTWDIENDNANTSVMTTQSTPAH